MLLYSGNLQLICSASIRLPTSALEIKIHTGFFLSLSFFLLSPLSAISNILSLLLSRKNEILTSAKTDATASWLQQTRK